MDKAAGINEVIHLHDVVSSLYNAKQSESKQQYQDIKHKQYMECVGHNTNVKWGDI